jgi:hypothetical protein
VKIHKAESVKSTTITFANRGKAITSDAADLNIIKI